MSTMGPDPDDQGMPPEVRAEADALMERWNEFADELRQMGLYVNGPPQFTPVPDPIRGQRLALVMQYTLGRIAFSKRVQDPESESFDDQFRVMEVQAQDDAFLDERQRIADALARGEDPYAPEDDDGD